MVAASSSRTFEFARNPLVTNGFEGFEARVQGDCLNAARVVLLTEGRGARLMQICRTDNPSRPRCCGGQLSSEEPV